MILSAQGGGIPKEILESMCTAVSHRGPDGHGTVFFDRSLSNISHPGSQWAIGMGHRRLSILDLSTLGHQPMSYRRDYWITYNGEVYNYLELRRELEGLGHSFRSSSDTEVVLASYVEWGVNCFHRFRGMWGLALLDLHRRKLIISRDRLGIKPLYWWRNGSNLAIASEIKQYTFIPEFSARLDPGMAREFLLRGYESPGRTFFADVHAFPAGTWAEIELSNLIMSNPQSFWFPERINVSINDPIDAAHEFTSKFNESVAIHMRSDVPIGCALSGGLDSSAIATTIRSHYISQNIDLHTFCMSFPGHAVDEGHYARAVAKDIGAIFHDITLDPQDFLNDLDRFVWHHDEPVGGISVYAAYRIAALTRKSNIRVSLNGQGGDEVLSGYWQNYFLHLRELGRRARFIKLFNHFAGAAFGSGNPELLRQVIVMGRRYRTLMSTTLKVKLRETDRNDRNLMQLILALQGQERRVFEIRNMSLPRLLKWEDRNSMSFSVEGRYPFLDHELIETCLAFSQHTLYHRGWAKWPLRQGLNNRLPAAILQRRDKNGFCVPSDRILFGVLADRIRVWLKEDRPIWQVVDQDSVQSLAEQAMADSGDETKSSILMRVFFFDRWLNIFKVKVED